MRWVTAFDLDVPPAHCFGVLRHFHAAYPRLHPAHLPHLASIVPGLLSPGYTFQLAERFGSEHRDYELSCTAYEPPRYLRVSGHSLTRKGRLRIRGWLDIELSLAPTGSGTRLTITQTVRFQHPVLNALLGHAWLWPSIGRHAADEARLVPQLMHDPAFAPVLEA